MLHSLINRAQHEDETAMMELINKFQPLFRKYARKLSYEDAYQDIILYFIELVKNIDLNKLTSSKEEVMISYISVCVRNFYNKKVPQLIQAKKETVLSALTEEQLYYVEKQQAKTDRRDILVEFGMKNLLNKSELQVIYLVYVDGYSTAEIARAWNKTRQSVNQLKQRALKKIKTACLQSC